MKVLVIGNGGREHALCWKLRQSPQIERLYCAPGNPGTSLEAENIAIDVKNINRLADFAKDEEISLTIVGPEYPLSLGIVDVFEEKGLRIFGPSQAAAQLESSKTFAKEVMREAGVSTAEAQTCHSVAEAVEVAQQKGCPIVLKADGLAAGKGVYVCHTPEDVTKAGIELTETIGASEVLVEDFLSGTEASFIAATDGERIVPLATSHDYKRIADHDEGPNTGGMGSVSPTPRLSSELETKALEEVIRPVIQYMAHKGTPLRGFLYAGLMVSETGEISVLEFNVRLGDPECQSILRRCNSDLAKLLYALSAPLAQPDPLPEISWANEAAVCVVLAAHGYPATPRRGDEISGIELAECLPGVKVFHAGTALAANVLSTAGGRVLSVTALGSDVEDARDKAYKAADMIQFVGRQMRRDIAV